MCDASLSVLRQIQTTVAAMHVERVEARIVKITTVRYDLENVLVDGEAGG